MPHKYTVRQRAKMVDDALEDPEIKPALRPPVDPVDVMTREIDCLVGKPYFNQFDNQFNLGVDIDIQKIDYSEPYREIQTHAPTWCRLLGSAMVHPRLSATETTMRQSLQAQMYMIMATICRERSRTKSNFLATILGLYLNGNGVMRRTLDYLTGFGFCNGYKQVYTLLNEKADKQKDGTEVNSP